MKQNPEIRAELEQIGVQIPWLDSHFEVPEGYFENNPEQVFDFVRQETCLDPYKTMGPLAVDPMYFASLSDSILEQIKTEDFLSQMPKESPYEIPKNYFGELSQQLQAKIKQPVTLKPQRFVSSKMASWSIAAALTFFILCGALLFKMSPELNAEEQLARIPDQEIQNYLQSHAAEFDLAGSIEGQDFQSIDLPSLEKEIFEKQFQDLTSEEVNEYL